jgi:hypothetical protein
MKTAIHCYGIVLGLLEKIQQLFVFKQREDLNLFGGTLNNFSENSKKPNNNYPVKIPRLGR